MEPDSLSAGEMLTYDEPTCPVCSGRVLEVLGELAGVTWLVCVRCGAEIPEGRD